jgi:hypothetical protein
MQSVWLPDRVWDLIEPSFLARKLSPREGDPECRTEPA